MSEAIATKIQPQVTEDSRVASALLAESDDILIVSHLRPDGDCLGSTIGLLLGLQSLGKRVAAYNATGVTDKWDWLAGIHHVRTELPNWKPRLTVFVDCGAIYRVSEEFQPDGMVLNIDHHLTNTRFGNLNYIDVETCAVGEQIFNILRDLEISVTKEIATALYLSILTDTGSFRYSNTSARALEIAGSLVAAGADSAYIALNVYESREKGEFLLTGRALSRMCFELGDAFVWSELMQKDYAECGGEDAEPEGLASEIRGVRGVEISALFHEMEDGSVRVGFRGKGNIDCSAIASACGGGGHFNASGAHLKDVPYLEGREKVLNLIREHVTRWQAGR